MSFYFWGPISFVLATNGWNVQTLPLKRGRRQNRNSKSDPRNKRTYLSLADGFIKLNRFDDALLELRDLITIYPGDIKYQVKFIRTLLAARRVDEAINEYHGIMGKNPNFSKDKYDMALYYQRKGNYQKVTKILNEALSSALNR